VNVEKPRRDIETKCDRRHGDSVDPTVNGIIASVAERLHPSPVFVALSAAEAADPPLYDDLLDLWVAVIDAGGAVGFTAPADREAVARTLRGQLKRVREGRDELVVLRHTGRAVGMAFLVESGSPLRRHWRTVLRVMVHPELQGAGAGRLLLEGLHGVARDLGLEQLLLSVRGGTGTEGFYERFGYEKIGRHPDAIRLAPDDSRDEIVMLLTL
jgi:GNAT superfamily N-acetyltransferase